MGVPVVGNTLRVGAVSDVGNRIIGRNSRSENTENRDITTFELPPRALGLFDRKSVHRALLFGQEIGFPVIKTKQAAEQISYGVIGQGSTGGNGISRVWTQ